MQKLDTRNNQIIEQLLKDQIPVIAWDWDGTISINGVFLIPEYNGLMQKLTLYYGFRHIIVTGRLMLFEPMGCEIDDLPIIYNVNKGNIFRFKLWALKYLYQSSKGVLRLYVDNNLELIEVLSKTGLPTAMSRNPNYQKILQMLEIHRRVEGNARIRQRKGLKG